MRLRAADDMNFAEGTLWSEGGAGTNAIGTALAADHAVQVFGPEHFNEVVQRWTCSAAPIHDPDTGEVIGVIDLTGDCATVHPHSLAVATATAQAVEAQPAARAAGARRAPARPLRRPRRRGAGSRALVTPSGRAIGTVPRGWGAGRPARDPARRRRARAALAATLAVAEPVSPAHEAFLVRDAVEPAACRHRAARWLKLALLGRDRATLERRRPPRRAAPAPGRDPRAAVRAPGRA